MDKKLLFETEQLAHDTMAAVELGRVSMVVESCKPSSPPPPIWEVRCGGKGGKSKSFMCDVARRARDKVFMESLNKKLELLNEENHRRFQTMINNVNKLKNDMEEKKFIKIEIPKGKELDEAAFKDGRIEWKDKVVTYEDVIKKLSDDKIILPHTAGTGIFPVFSQGQLNKLIALNKLMNVAKYLNGDWKFERCSTTGYCILIGVHGGLGICATTYKVYGDILFKSEEDARKAINILGEDVIRQALSTDY